MMDYKGLNVIDRKPGYSNLEMLNHCNTLYEIVTKTKDIKVLDGRAYVIKQVLKHKTDKETMDRLSNSIEYYQKLHETEMNNQIELRDYQKRNL